MREFLGLWLLYDFYFLFQPIRTRELFADRSNRGYSFFKAFLHLLLILFLGLLPAFSDFILQFRPLVIHERCANRKSEV